MFFQELKGKREIECERMDGNIGKKYSKRESEGTEGSKEREWRKRKEQDQTNKEEIEKKDRVDKSRGRAGSGSQIKPQEMD